ncbi:MAG: 7-carboxy-7-deazaguanine synthase QueE [Planctomycetota bacterium]
MKIAEIYKSVQGEGRLTGEPSVFVRVSGCNLRCWFCDTPHASWHPEGRDYAVDEIVAQIEEWDCRHVVITGGEPMLFSEVIPLTERLRASGRHITIETAGTLYLPVECDLMSISPKLAGSGPSSADHLRWRRRHERERFRPSVIARLIRRHEYQLKFVVHEPADVPEVQALVEAVPGVDPLRVMLMPQGTCPEELKQRTEWLESLCRERGWGFCPRRHIEWFGPARRT